MYILKLIKQGESGRGADNTALTSNHEAQTKRNFILFFNLVGYKLKTISIFFLCTRTLLNF